MEEKIKAGVELSKERAKAVARWYALRRRLLQNWAQFVVPAALLLGLFSVRVSGWTWVEMLQRRAFDQLIVLKPRAYEPVPVRVIDIDDENLDKLGQWPWPRTQVARLVDRLNALGAAVIAFDSVFAEPDRTSPARVMAGWPSTPEVEALKKSAARLPDNDAALAKSFSKSNVVAGFALVGEKNEKVPAAKAFYSFSGGSPVGYLKPFGGAVVNLPELERAAAGNGNFGLASEPDGVVRRVPLMFRLGHDLVPSLAAEALRVAQGEKGYKVKSSDGSGELGGRVGVGKVKIGRLVVPTDPEGSVWVYFTKAAPGRTIPAWKLFEKGFDPAQLEGSITFIGTSAAGLKDLRVTALDPALPGVEVHANLAEQALLGRYIERPYWADAAEEVYLALFGLALVLLLPLLGAALCAWVGAGAIALALWATWRAFTAHGYLLDPVFPSLTVLGVYMSSSLISYLKSETERRQVRNAFTRYMHPKLVEELAKHPDKLKLGGETRTMTVLFCDIRGFTTISEQYDAHGLTKVINRFLTPMTGIIMDKLGYIDKYIGDCIMAFWNAPLDDARHAANACEAALTMLETLKDLNAKWKAEAEAEGRKHLPINIGVGLNTGPCHVGNMGADQRFNYSVLGDDVNLASRLEGQSKNYGVGLVIGPRTREQAAEYAALELDLIKVKGKTVPVNIYTVLGRPDVAAQADFKKQAELHAAMLAAYRRQDWDGAEKLLAGCRGCAFKLEKLYDIYAERIKAYRAGPPAGDWDGTYTATSK